MRLTNGDDQSVIRRIIPDSLGGFDDLLSVLDVGESLVVGDASLLPTRFRVGVPCSRACPSIRELDASTVALSAQALEGVNPAAFENLLVEAFDQ